MRAEDVRSLLERAELSLTARVVGLGRLVGSSAGPCSLGERLGLSEAVVRGALEELRAAGLEVGREGERPTPPESAVCEAEVLEASLSSTRRALMVSWSEAWLTRFGPAPPAQLAAVQELAPWLLEYARRREESAEELAAVLVGAFFVAKGASRHRPRVAWLAEDPGRYLDPDSGLIEKEREIRSRARALEGRRERDASERRLRARDREHASSYQRKQYGSGPVPVGSVLLELLRDGGVER